MVVTDCVASIDISGVNLPFLENTWYSTANSYDITGISSDIVQYPACGYGYVYNASWQPDG